ncbi:outer membrane protein assembly factor BamE [Hydrogenophaga sp.]|uniref:outer membrane protein assembly factor BamE n=2 Tax=Hydrogenophaga sp. TaxID=1904254 RepID=UPI0027292768|nr:outer membrane protein assembly factor BamE [Hydrogenophaga sp.]MDO9132405.1 outer membrane protein assembly factor BamE [Hydrogenophaga sp.]MDP1783498.1 outer membrane protein assembly factor BamE [Hydrogenophaga sp.]MDP2076330.1 outer membrane protein assembly factor BamE [Hydrogenophaga sp.]MDP3110323.1 outer membrane protein assembly factor BamE [Hydrogenophaga sp.]
MLHHSPDCASPTTRGQRLRRPVALLCAMASLVALSACSSVTSRLPGITSVVTPYKIDILQGNVVTREQAAALQTGMGRDQVRDILGSPLLISVFHADRWDYVFTFRRQGQAPQQRRLTAFFKADLLERFEADELPSEAEFVASLDAGRKFGKVPPLQATEAQLKAFDERNKTTAPVEPAAPVAAPATSYPPLETPGTAR